MFTRIRRPLVVGVIAFALAVSGGALIVSAQETTPTPGSSVATANYPIAIHTGTCASLTAQPDYSLDNAVPFGSDDDDADQVGSADSSTSTSQVATSQDAADTELKDLTESPHAIAVHASPDAYGTIVACGDIAGTKVDDKLVVALQPVDGSGIQGVALMEDGVGLSLSLGDSNFSIGEGQVKVTVFVLPDSGS